MIYFARRLKQYAYQNSALVYKSDGFLLEPFHGRSYAMPFDWGISRITFAGTHLALSILADHYNIAPSDAEFSQHVESLVINFYDYFLRNAGDNWEIDSDDIDDWIDEINESAEEYLESIQDEETDDREITFSVAYQIKPTALRTSL